MLTEQYELIIETRGRVLDHLSTLPKERYIQESDTFPKKSIRNLLVHSANVYLFWLEGYLQSKTVTFFTAKDIDTIDQLREAYERVDSCVKQFIGQYSDKLGQSISNQVPRYDFSITTTPLQIFTHAITHEFHHKGQIMTRSRKLGYPPPDTDVIHFETSDS